MQSNAARLLVTLGALAVGLALGGFAVHVFDTISCFYRVESARWFEASGRVEAPSGIDLSRLSVVPSRGDHWAGVGGGGVNAEGDFSLRVEGNEPFDLQVLDRPGDWYEKTHQMRRTLHAVGRLEGVVRGVTAGCRGVAIGLVPRLTTSITVRVRAV